MKDKIMEELSSLYKARSAVYEREGHSRIWHKLTGQIENLKKKLAEVE